jgi:hypothetical protein
MPTTFSMADADVVNLIARVMARRYPRLHDAGVKVGTLLARNPDGPPIKSGGYEVLATIKPVPLKDRLTKGYDAELLIDGGEYERLRSRQQEALIAHELAHIDTVDLTPAELKAREGDDSVTWKTDDLGRPKLKSVPGDWIAGDGFKAVVAEYGTDAIEYEMLARCKARADAAKRAGELGQEV